MFLVNLIIGMWLLQGTLSSILAFKKGYNPATWFFMGFFLGIFGLFTITFLPPFSEFQDKAGEDPILLSLREKTWYFLSQDKVQHGPMSFEALKKAVLDKKVLPSSYIWHDELKNWKKLSDLKECEQYFRDA